jgi:hypothetical protein
MCGYTKHTRLQVNWTSIVNGTRFRDTFQSYVQYGTHEIKCRIDGIDRDEVNILIFSIGCSHICVF